LATEADAVNVKLCAKSEEVARFRVQLHERDESIQEKNNEIRRLVQHNNSLTQMATAANTSQNEQNHDDPAISLERIKKLEDENQKLKDQILGLKDSASLPSTQDSLAFAIGSAHSELSRLRQEMGDIQSLNSAYVHLEKKEELRSLEYQETISQNEMLISELQSNIDAQSECIRNKESESADKDIRIHTLKNLVESAQVEYSTLDQSHKMLRNMYNNIAAVNASLQTERDNLSASAQGEVLGLQESLTDLQNNISAKDDQINDLVSELDTERQFHEITKADLVTEKQTTKNLNERIREIDSKGVELMELLNKSDLDKKWLEVEMSSLQEQNRQMEEFQSVLKSSKYLAFCASYKAQDEADLRSLRANMSREPERDNNNTKNTSLGSSQENTHKNSIVGIAKGGALATFGDGSETVAPPSPSKSTHLLNADDCETVTPEVVDELSKTEPSPEDRIGKCIEEARGLSEKSHLIRLERFADTCKNLKGLEKQLVEKAAIKNSSTDVSLNIVFSNDNSKTGGAYKGRYKAFRPYHMGLDIRSIAGMEPDQLKCIDSRLPAQEAEKTLPGFQVRKQLAKNCEEVMQGLVGLGVAAVPQLNQNKLLNVDVLSLGQTRSGLKHRSPMNEQASALRFLNTYGWSENAWASLSLGSSEAKAAGSELQTDQGPVVERFVKLFHLYRQKVGYKHQGLLQEVMAQRYLPLKQEFEHSKAKLRHWELEQRNLLRVLSDFGYDKSLTVQDPESHAMVSILTRQQFTLIMKSHDDMIEKGLITPDPKGMSLNFILDYIAKYAAQDEQLVGFWNQKNNATNKDKDDKTKPTGSSRFSAVVSTPDSARPLFRRTDGRTPGNGAGSILTCGSTKHEQRHHAIFTIVLYCHIAKTKTLPKTGKCPYCGMHHPLVHIEDGTNCPDFYASIDTEKMAQECNPCTLRCPTNGVNNYLSLLIQHKKSWSDLEKENRATVALFKKIAPKLLRIVRMSSEIRSMFQALILAILRNFLTKIILPAFLCKRAALPVKDSEKENHDHQ